MAAILSQLKYTIAILAEGDTEDYALDIKCKRYLGRRNRDISVANMLGTTSGCSYGDRYLGAVSDMGSFLYGLRGIIKKCMGSGPTESLSCS